MASSMDAPINDPYRTCEEHCNHDLARGVGIAELLGTDGPYPPSQLVVSLNRQQTVLFDDAHEPVHVAAEAV